jgi:hypothetical protein
MLFQIIRSRADRIPDGCEPPGDKPTGSWLAEDERCVNTVLTWIYCPVLGGNINTYLWIEGEEAGKCGRDYCAPKSVGDLKV